MSEYSICHDTQSCIRCFSCMINCLMENRVRLQREKAIGVEKTVQERLPHLAVLTPQIREVGRFPEARHFTAFRHCMHCERPACAELCPSKGIEKRKNGAVVIDEDLCVGCGSCTDACPYDGPLYDAETKKAYKCNMCYDRVENGLNPACVEACLTKAMFSGTREEVIAEAGRRAKLYEAQSGKRYIVYGADRINDYVGKTGWMTISPKEDAEYRGLLKDPYKASIVYRDHLKTGGAVLTGAAVVLGLSGHFIHWLQKRKNAVRQLESEEEKR
jgi:formate dehydrogenase iron-sulfur subunit